MGRSFLAESQGDFARHMNRPAPSCKAPIAGTSEPFAGLTTAGINCLVFMFNGAAIPSGFVSMGLPWRSHFVNA
jgi:hypothetical protein